MLLQNPCVPFRSGAITDVKVADAGNNLDDLVYFSPEDVTSIIFYNYVKRVHIRPKDILPLSFSPTEISTDLIAVFI